MITNKEKQILATIKFAPIFLIIFIALIVTTSLYIENKETFLKEKRNIENTYFLENKKDIKEEVERFFEYIDYMKKNSNDSLKKQIKSRVYKAHEVATHIYNKLKDTHSKEEILNMIKISLTGMRYDDGKGYLFMDDIYGNKIFHPIDTSIEGKNFLNYKDVNGYELFKTIVQTIKDKSERFDEYYWYKPNTNKEVGKKVSFYKYFEPLNMAIGTGIYIDDFEENIKKEVLNFVSNIKFQKHGYVFIVDSDLKVLSHLNKDLINKNLEEIQNLEEFTAIAKNIFKKKDYENRYYKYKYQVDNSDSKLQNKMSYIKVFKEWGWLVGSGFYVDNIVLKIEKKKKELDSQFDTYIQNIFVIALFLTFILLLISFYISYLLESKFNEYKIDINKKQSILHQQSKMAAMGEMIGNIAHQWRQPLSTITTAASGMALQKEIGILTDEMFYETTKKINASAQHLSKTIDDFRNFFSPEKVKTEFLLKNTFTTTLDLVSAQFNTNNIKIIKHIDNIQLFTYENELIQALINILNNSRDELIKLPEDVERLIFIDVYKNKKEETVIIIKDNAGGIPLDIMDKIFEPYFTTKHKSQGTGIGLYMTEEIVVKHLEGKIFVKNKDFIYKNIAYKGAQFKIVLN